MKTISETLIAEEIAQIASKDDFKIAPFRTDGETYGTLTWIWSVSVNNRLFVRSYNGINGRWYQSAISQEAGKITGAGLEKKVTFTAIQDVDLNEKIDQAYGEKYSGSPYLGSMISDSAKAANVEITAFVDG